jgi:hypothetical protein
MKKLPSFLLWAIVFFLLLLALDQLWVRVPMQQPALAAVREFYLEFRGRLLHLAGGPAPVTIESVIDQAIPDPPKSPSPLLKPALPVSPAQPATTTPRFLYVDSSGTLQFADRLEDIPAPYRASARPLER